LALADAAALRTDAGLVIGTNVEAWDADLDDIAALTPTNDDIVQRKAGHWTNRTMAQLIADLAALNSTFQPLDSDLTSIAALATTSYGRNLLTLANEGAADWVDKDILTTKGDILVATAASTPARLGVGSNTQVLTADSTQTTGVKWAPAAGGSSTLTRSVRTSNTILAAGDNGTLIDATATFTQTLTAAATLGAGWWCYIKNDTADGTTVLTIDPNASETVDGLTTLKMYSGDTRILMCDGANFETVLIDGGYAKFVAGSSTFTVPSGIQECEAVCVGSGGQGGGGFSGVGGACVSGGRGGGGAAATRARFRTSDLGAAGTGITVTVSSGGSAGGGAGANGSDGGNTSFGTLLLAGGGGGGRAGASAANSTGASGGCVIGSATGTTGAILSGSGGADCISGQGAHPTSANAVGNNAEWGGAGGGGCQAANAAGKNGGSSIFGGAGGGAGAGSTLSTGTSSGGAGGTSQSYAVAGGGAAGTSGGAGGDGAFVGPYCGSAGGGGASSNSGTAGKGGKGSIGSGGGGGGACANGTGGAGGNGGDGECRVWYS
jgi:hypothetical protein